MSAAYDGDFHYYEKISTAHGQRWWPFRMSLAYGQ